MRYGIAVAGRPAGTGTGRGFSLVTPIGGSGAGSEGVSQPEGTGTELRCSGSERGAIPAPRGDGGSAVVM